MATQTPWLSSVFDLRFPYGGKGDGSTDNTSAITAAIAAASAAGGGTVYISSGTWLCGAFALAANVSIQGEQGTVLKCKNAVNGTFITMSAGSILRGLTIDGNGTNQSGLVFGNATVYFPSGATGAKLIDCTLKNAGYNDVYVIAATDVLISGNTFAGGGTSIQPVCYFAGLSHRLTVRANRFSGCPRDCIKIHANDGVTFTQTTEAPLVEGNRIDYRGLTLTNTPLAIELWAGTSGFAAGSPGCVFGKVTHNTIWGPDGGGTTKIYGVSIDNSFHVTVDANTVNGPNVGIALECAGGTRCTYANNTVDGADYGWSVSQTAAGNKFVGNTVRNISTYGAQLNGTISSTLFSANRFTDAGSRCIFLNDSGYGTAIFGNSFVASATMQDIYAIYAYSPTFQSTSGSSAVGNIVYSDRAGAGTHGIAFGYFNHAYQWRIADNQADGHLPGSSSFASLDGLTLIGNQSGHWIDHNTVVAYGGRSFYNTSNTASTWRGNTSGSNINWSLRWDDIVLPDNRDATTAVAAHTASYALTAQDVILPVQMDATSGAQIVTVGSAVGVVGRTYTIEKIDSSANTVTLSSGQVLSAQDQTVTIQSDGAAWQTVSMANVPITDAMLSGTHAALTNAANTFTGSGQVMANGDTSSGSNNKFQFRFGYNGTSQYGHFIASWHNAVSGNRLVFYVSDGTQNGSFPTNAVACFCAYDGNLGIGNTNQFGSGKGVIGIPDAATLPTANSSVGGVLYSDAGALKWRGKSGTVTTIASA